MATATYPVWAFPASARAVLHQNGKLIVQSGSQDIGTGTYTIMTQIAADSFGVPVETIKFELGDTKLPPSGVSGGSTSATCVGTAVQSACHALRDKFIDMAIADTKSPLFRYRHSGDYPEVRIIPCSKISEHKIEIVNHFDSASLLQHSA